MILNHVLNQCKFKIEFITLFWLSIANMENINIKTTSLWFDNCQITEIKGLNALLNLQELHLGNNQITEIKGLPQLNIIQFILNCILNLNIQVNLQTLYLNCNQITEIKGLNELANLQYLDLRNNQITEIKGLEALANLQYLGLNNNQITEIKGLESLINLRWLDLDNNQITEIKGLNMLFNLQILNLNDNKIKINYLTLQIPLRLAIYLTSYTINATPHLMKGHKICIKVSRLIAAKIIQWSYRNHHLLKPYHPFYRRWMEAIIKQYE